MIGAFAFVCVIVAWLCGIWTGWGWCERRIGQHVPMRWPRGN